MTDQIVSLREYVEALLRENQRATQLAEQEREKAAEAVRQATDRAIEKMGDAQQALTITLQDRMDAGDERLREHINFQYSQIAQALDSARREAAFAQAASEKAIQKAETAAEKRFEAVNEFRGQLADQAQQFLPREVYDAQHADLGARVDQLATRLDQAGGRDAERAINRETATGWKIAAASGAVSVVVVVSQLAFG